MMNFLRKNYRPWTILWVLQRFSAVVKERRLPQIRMTDLLYDLRLTRKINKSLKAVGNRIETRQHDPESDIFNLIPSFEYHPMIVNEDSATEDLSGINHHFDHVYVVNLARKQDRRVEIIQKLKKYRIKAEIFEARDDGLNPEIEKEFYDFYRQPVGSPGTHHLEQSLQKKMIGSPGSWGYLKTYKKIITDAKQNNFNRILCFDDDVLFHLSFERELEKALKNLPPDWKLLYLGASQHDWNVPYSVDYPESLTQKDFEKHPWYYPVKTDGSFAVGIDSSVFDEILLEIDLMNCALDSGPLRTIQQKYPRQCFVLNPNLVVADVRSSNIGVDRDQEHMAEKFRWKMGLFDYPFSKEMVSVIMPAFNAERTIEKSIRSILQQSYKELEIIVADDASSDSTPEIVEQLAREDSRVRLVRLESNQGCYPARNAALRASNGKYIAIQDSDDISLGNRIETQLIPILAGRAEFTLSRMFRSRCTVEELDIDRQQDMIRLVLDRRIKSPSGMYEYRDKPVIGLVTSVFTRKLFEDYGLFWESRFGSDAEFLERVIYHKTGVLLSKKDRTIHSYLMDRDSIPGLYQRIDKVLLISAGMTEDNISNIHSRQEKSKFEEIWRKRLKGDYHYDYPTLFNQSIIGYE